jgi:threonine dehydratase
VSGGALESDLARSHEAALETRARIRRWVRETPLIEAAPGLLLKLETLQRTGSFKVRGAASALTAGHLAGARSVIAASTGNHGLAVAHVAAGLGMSCRVFVPSSASGFKLARLRAAGVELVEVAGDPLRAELAAREAAASDGALFVSPYNDPLVVLGQASVGLELTEQLGEEPQALFVAVGGGGLISGISLAVRAHWSGTRIVGCVPAASPAMADAVAAGGRAVASRLEDTLSDATAGGIEEGSITLAICAALVDDWLEIGEEEIAAAMRIALLDHHVAAEGAAGLALAGALREGGAGGGPRVAVLGGANAGATALEAVLHV